MFFHKRKLRKQREAAERARRLRLRRRLDGFLVRAEKGEVTLEQAHNALHKSHPILTPQERDTLLAFIRQLHEDKQFGQSLERLRSLQQKYRVARKARARLDAALEFYNAYRSSSAFYHPERVRQRFESELGLSVVASFDLLKDAVHQYYERLMPKRNEFGSFNMLRVLILRTRQLRDPSVPSYDRDGDLMKAGIDPLPYPSDWNELVARFVTSPLLHDFVHLPELGWGEVRLLAAEALRDDDFTNAQIALAYCAHDRGRAVIGDKLMAELAMLVTSHRDEQKSEVGSSRQTAE